MNTYNPSPNQYSKRNFVEVLEILSPKIYEAKDIELSGVGIQEDDQIINTQINAANKMASILPVSGRNDISSISQFFIKQNELTYITPQTFEDDILYPLGYSFEDFETQEQFTEFLSATLQPKIKTNATTLATTTSGVFGATASAVHDYLIDNLGWIYFLNNSSGVWNYQPSSYVTSQLSGLYIARDIKDLDGVIGFNRHLWYNYSSYIPTSYLSSVGTYTSGTQQLDKLETMLEVIFSPAYMDRQDFKVKDAFIDYIDGLGLLDELKPKGPHRKFLKAISYSMADINNNVEKLASLYDIENCEPEYLEQLAKLIGWKLLGPDASKWRQQLRSATEAYKKKGTSVGIQFVLNSIISDVLIDASGTLTELWESYVPFMIWYMLATDSIHFKNQQVWTKQKAESLGIFGHDPSSFTNNIQSVVDHILLEAYYKFPDNFIYQGKPWPVYRFLELDNDTGEPIDIYTLITDPLAKDYLRIDKSRRSYRSLKVEQNEQGLAYDNSFQIGPEGEGIYIAGSQIPQIEKPVYLSSTGDSKFVFNYRNYRNFPIPPFEEIKYYKECKLDEALISFFTEKVRCLGVGDNLTDAFGNYLRNNTYKLSNVYGAINDFLMFFSAMQNPVNYFEALDMQQGMDFDIQSLWNAKSSHVLINYSATNFSFTKRDITGDSKYALTQTKEVLNKFLPAHAIPILLVDASSPVENYTTSETSFNTIELKEQQTMYSLVSGVFAGREASGINIRGIFTGTITPEGLTTFKREEADALNDLLVSSTNYTNTTPRKSLRRRNYKFVLPQEKYYDRTGFNQPISFDGSSAFALETSKGFIVLGFVASSNSFYPVYDYTNPSGVWDPCENLSSDNTFFGIDTSNTYPCRGAFELDSDAKMTEIGSRHDRYVDRCQIPYIYRAMHSIKENEALARSEIIVSSNTSYNEDSHWKNQALSVANNYINSGVMGINSYSDYENFKFGRGIHLLFKDYKKYFNHGLGPSSIDETGANIFSHTFGPLLYNANFSVEGSAVTTQEGNYIASSLDVIVPIGYGEGSGVFTTCAVNNGYASGTYIASTINSMIVPLEGIFSSGQFGNAEFRNPHILSGIEFVQTSGASRNNKFELIKLDQSLFEQNDDQFLADKLFIKSYSINGLPRLRFDLSAYGSTANTLIKDHYFNLNIKAQIGNDNSTNYGGGALGVWIHTDVITAENGDKLMWCWTPRKKWELIVYDNLTQRILLNDLAHIKNFRTFSVVNDPEFRSDIRQRCIGNEVQEYETVTELPPSPTFNYFKENYLENFDIPFDTRNYTIYNNYEYLQIIPVPEHYYKLRNLVHGQDINYYVEIFKLNQPDTSKYLLLSTISLQDLTLKQNSGFQLNYGIETSSIPLVPFVEEARFYTDKEQLRSILRFFNDLIEDPYTSRIALNSSGILDTSGGSRINYKIHPDLAALAGGGGSQITSLNIVN
jgi:hypothetical protein